jgi:hypothetical protein
MGRPAGGEVLECAPGSRDSWDVRRAQPSLSVDARHTRPRPVQPFNSAGCVGDSLEPSKGAVQCKPVPPGNPLRSWMRRSCPTSRAKSGKGYTYRTPLKWPVRYECRWLRCKLRGDRPAASKMAVPPGIPPGGLCSISVLPGMNRPRGTVVHASRTPGSRLADCGADRSLLIFNLSEKGAKPQRQGGETNGARADGVRFVERL